VLRQHSILRTGQPLNHGKHAPNQELTIDGRAMVNMGTSSWSVFSIKHPQCSLQCCLEIKLDMPRRGFELYIQVIACYRMKLYGNYIYEKSFGFSFCIFLLFIYLGSFFVVCLFSSCRQSALPQCSVRTHWNAF
jgi:hypothetical protein